MRVPTHVWHADWGTDRKKRWVAKALLEGSDTYIAYSATEVGQPGELIPSVRGEIGKHGSALVGFDFPIGVPAFYARKARIRMFKRFLLQLEKDNKPWRDFYSVARRPSQISLYRPFYPFKPGAAKQRHLLKALGAASMSDLRRHCELGGEGRRTACPLFWTLGANQVGKAAIAGWRDVLAPALGSHDSVLLWPFDGPLRALFKPGKIVLAETYPAECYRWIFSSTMTNKRDLANRKALASELLSWANRTSVRLDAALHRQIKQGFLSGDDSFDAVIGLFGVLEVLLKKREPGEPNSKQVKRVEGWILGR